MWFLMTEYVSQYTYAECAASALWSELSGTVGLQDQGLSKIDTGAEKFVYSAPTTLQEACRNQAKYYSQLCRNLNGEGSAAIKVAHETVAGVTGTFGRTDDS